MLANERNLGFTLTANRGMREARETADVVLLNSDTVVTPGWLEKLARCAASGMSSCCQSPPRDHNCGFSITFTWMECATRESCSMPSSLSQLFEVEKNRAPGGLRVAPPNGTSAIAFTPYDGSCFSNSRAASDAYTAGNSAVKLTPFWKNCFSYGASTGIFGSASIAARPLANSASRSAAFRAGAPHMTPAITSAVHATPAANIRQPAAL